MKTNLYPLLLLSALFSLILWSCGKDENPDNEYHDPWSLVQEVYIGSAGGVIDTSGIRFEIPAGVFDQSEKISLYICEENTFGSNQASPVYELRGFPEDFEAVLPVRIKTDKALQAEFYLAAGVLDYAKSMQDTVYSTTFFPAEDSSGYLLSAITVYGSTHASGAGREGGPAFEFLPEGKVIVSAESNFDYYETIEGHFRVNFTKPDVTLAQAAQLGAALEVAWQKYKDMEFNYAKLDGKYRIPVTYRAFKESSIPLVGDNPRDWGAYTPGWTGFSPSFEFNSVKLLPDTKKVAPTAGHECFHMVQSLYNTHGELKNWMTEATATYCEELFSEDGANYFPEEFGSHWYRPLVGMQAGTYFADPEQPSNSSYHGYGMAPIIKYLVQHATVPNPLKVMIEGLNNDMHPVDAAFSVMPGANVSSIWQLAMLNYISKGAYKDLSQRVFTDGELYHQLNWGKMITLKASETNFPDASYLLPDLSATFTRISLEGNFSPEQELDINLVVAGEASDFTVNTYYFIYKNVGETPLSNSPTAGTTKLKSLKDNNNSIAVLVMNSRHENPYTDLTHVTLEFRIKGRPVVSAGSPTDITATSARLNGVVNPSGVATGGVFQYGISTSYGNELVFDHLNFGGYTPNNVYVDLTGLTPNTTYHYRIEAINELGETFGEDKTFKTLEGSVVLPTITTYNVIDLSAHSATMQGKVNPHGVPTYCGIDIGLTTAYEMGTGLCHANPFSGDEETIFYYDAGIPLQANTTYHYRAVAWHYGGQDHVYGEDKTFTTPPE